MSSQQSSQQSSQRPPRQPAEQPAERTAERPAEQPVKPSGTRKAATRRTRTAAPASPGEGTSRAPRAAQARSPRKRAATSTSEQRTVVDVPSTRHTSLTAGVGTPDGEPAPDTLDVTIVLPCYNEEEHVLGEIERICRVMDESPFSYELLAIDDKSTDNTLETLRKALLEYPRLRLMPFTRNGGSGTARRIGTQEAYGRIVVWTDADMTYPNERIPEFVQYLYDNPHVDQVVGARTTEQGTYKFLRVPAKWLIRKLAETLSGTRIPDLNSGLRAFRREVSLPYLRLLPPGFSCVTTLTMSFLSNQHAVDYLPIAYAKRAGTSKFRFVRDAYRYILQVLRMVMYFNPLKVLMPVSLALLFGGFLKGTVDLFVHDLRITSNATLLFVTGLIIGSMALLADLIVRSRGDA